MSVKQLTLEKRLFQMAGKKPADDLIRIYQAVKNDMHKHLSSVSARFPHYSRHDISHVESILDSIEIILGNERIKQLSIGDIWLIILSAYLHDIGMLISYEEEKAAWRSEEFAKFLSTCEQDDDKELRKAAAAAQGKESKTDLLLIKKYVTQLTAEFFRQKHAERSKEIIAGNSPIGKLLSFDIPKELQNVWECAGNIVALHGRSFDDILDEAKFRNFPIPHCGDYHPRFVSVLLRLGDLCDVKRGRFNNMSLEQFGLLPDVSAQHYYKHETMQDTQIGNENITLVARIKFAEIKRELSNEKQLSETEQEDFCQKVVYQHVNWFHMLDSELANFKRYRDDIFPPGMSNNIPKFDPKIFVNTEEVTLSLEDLRFNFSREKAYELIEGYSLYDDPLTFVRELIQNSLDALKQQMWLDLNSDNPWFEELIPQDKRACKDTLTPFDFTDGKDAIASLQRLYSRYRIDISVKYDRDKKTAEIIFEDNGIGITREDIKNKILQTGTSWQGRAYQEQLAAMPAWLRPTGSFGIGLHSVFAVANHFRIETKSRKESKEPKGNIIVLHSGQRNGFVFSRSDETTIKRNGTRVILETTPDKIPDTKIDVSPYEAAKSNPVMEALREYIESNVICPLFDVYLHDGYLQDEERNKQPPVVAKLCDHAVYGKLFDPAVRNCLLNGTPLPSDDLIKGYDIAISNYRPLRFVIWDKKVQTLYEIEPIIDNRLYFYEKEPYKSITYMGIVLREHKKEDLNKIDYLYVCHVEILAGNGKADITANRNRLKRDKATSVNKELMEIVKIITWLGQKLLTTIIQADITQRFLTQVNNDAVQILQYDDMSWRFTDLKNIFLEKKPSFVDQVLYTIFVFRCFIRKKRDAFLKSLENISLPKDDDTKESIADFCLRFAHIWCNDQFLKLFIKWLLKLCLELAGTFDNVSETYKNKLFGQQFAGAFSNELCKEFHYDLSYKYRDELENAFSNELKQAFGSEFGNEYCSEFGYGFGDGFCRLSIVGSAFGTNNNHYDQYGILGSSLCGKFDSNINYEITANAYLYNGNVENSFIDKLGIPSSDIHIDLLANDNWTWIFWLSKGDNSLIRSFLEITRDYFLQLAGFNSGYGFDEYNTVMDIFTADKLTAPISVLSDDFYAKFSFLQYMALTHIQQKEKEFIITLKRYDPNKHVFVSADKDIILEWLKEKSWGDAWDYHLFPCFIHYAKLGVHMENDYKLYLYKKHLMIPSGTPALIFPKKINGIKRPEFVRAAENVEAAVAGIMACEQVVNIVDYIWRHRLQEDSTCSREEIYLEYEQLMRDYVGALGEETKVIPQ